MSYNGKFFRAQNFMHDRNTIRCFSIVSQNELSSAKWRRMSSSVYMQHQIRLLKPGSIIKPVNYVVALILPPLVKSEQITCCFGMNVFSMEWSFFPKLTLNPLQQSGYANVWTLADSGVFSAEWIFPVMWQVATIFGLIKHKPLFDSYFEAE